MRAVLLLTFFTVSQGHGRLTVPTPRNGGNNPQNSENAPTGISDTSNTNFVCRHSQRNEAVDLKPVTAGGSLGLQWSFSAAHVGDCAVYISYDTDLPLSEQRYFKIANLPKCRDQRETTVTIAIPDFLPAGNAIMRWDWYALHQHPAVEFFNQCVDITISSSSTVAIPQVTSLAYTINSGIYPNTGNVGVGFRNPFGNGEQFVTGPECINGITFNNCGLTAVGKSGNTRSGGLISTPVPTPGPTPEPTPTTTSTTTSITTPTPASTPTPGGNCCRNTDCAGNPWCDNVAFDTYCPENGAFNFCPEPMCTTNCARRLTAQGNSLRGGIPLV